LLAFQLNFKDEFQGKLPPQKLKEINEALSANPYGIDMDKLTVASMIMELQLQGFDYLATYVLALARDVDRKNAK